MQGVRVRPNSSAGWVATFADLAALMLTFFVLTFSMATLEPVLVAEGANDPIEFPGLQPDFATELQALSSRKVKAPEGLGNYLSTLFAAQLEAMQAGNGFQWHPTEKGVFLTFEGSSHSSRDWRDQLDSMAPLLAELSGRASFSAAIHLSGVSSGEAVYWLEELTQAASAIPEIGSSAVKLDSHSGKPTLGLELSG